MTSLLRDIFSLDEARISINIKPLMLGGWRVDEPHDAGCVIRMHATGQADPQSSMDAAVHAWINATLKKSSKEEICAEVTHLIEYQTDAYEDVLSVAGRLEKSPTLMIGRDEVEWLSSPLLLPYSLLRRLAAPMYLVDEKNSDHLVPSRASFVESILMKSLVLRDAVGNAVYARIKEIERNVKAMKTKKRKLSPPEKHSVKCLKSLHQTLVAMMERVTFDKNKPLFELDPSNREKRKLPASHFLPPQGAPEQTVAVRLERQRIMEDLKRRIRNKTKGTPLLVIGTQVEFPKNEYCGTLLLTSKDVSCDEFYRHRDIMELVNKTIRRPYKSGYSIPKLQRANISDKAMGQLNAIFFNKDGSLNKQILNDTDFTARNGYINFGNNLCGEKRTDKRWQVPLQRHSPNTRSVGTRVRIEELMSDEKFLNSAVETIHDLGVLIGGTQDQSLHHDIPRQSITWLTRDPNIFKKSNLHPFIGWEFDRAAYNEAMAIPNAPRSLLLSMHDSKIACIGVQKNQVDKCGYGDEFCTVEKGVRGQKFRIIRETEFLVVLQAKPGVVFTGDFVHAGVRNFQIGSSEDKLMRDLFNKVEGIIDSSTHLKHSEIAQKVFKMMCNFSNLDKICRFHCSTEPLRSQLQIPRNTVGFVGCCPNTPDSRFDDEEHHSVHSMVL